MERPLGADAGVWVDLAGGDRDGPSPPATGPPSRPRPGRRWWLVALVPALVAGVVLLAAVRPGPVEPPERAVPDPDRAAVPRRSRPVIIDAATVAPPPWRGLFEHHPTVPGAAEVDRVHALTLTGAPTVASPVHGLLVVDATRRAFFTPGAEAGGGAADVRVLGPGAGDGLRTLQWDAGGYGLSLTTRGLSATEQRQLAAGVRLPTGPSLLSGRAPRLDPDVADALGVRVGEVRSGPASPLGSHLIGQSGSAAIDGQIHQVGARRILVSVVQDQVVTAELVGEALGRTGLVDHAGIDGVSTAAVIAHAGDAPREGRIRGWTRLVLDHDRGVTIELVSDEVGAAGLLAAAVNMDLDRLARTLAPLAGSGT